MIHSSSNPLLPSGIPTGTYGVDAPQEVAPWEVLDIHFRCDAPVNDPFAVEFGATFIGPQGAELDVPGFYNGGTQWVLRFSAPAPGEWTFTTHSSLESLRGKTGAIAITPNLSPDRHGGIVVREDNPRHFQYEDSTPYMLQAFECDWLFALDYDNPTGTPQTEHLLDLLAENGINQIVTTVYSYDVQWEKDERLNSHPEHEFGGRDTIYPFLGTNPNPDYSALNVAFFQNLDRMVHLMDQKGIVAHLMIYVWNKNVNWPAADSEADNQYFDYIVKRYQAFPNVIWDVSKEALNNQRCSEPYGLERIQRIRALDAYDRLVTVHDYGFCDRHSKAVDFISIQTWSGRLYSDMLEIYEKFDKPVFNIEHGGYEASPYVTFPGDYVDPEVCLRRNYLCYFAGAYATYYWQGAAWNVIIPNPFEQPADFAKPRFDYYKHLHAFFSSVGYDTFHPFPESNGSCFCLKSDRGIYLIYMPKENYQLSAYKKEGLSEPAGTQQWFNTLTGEYTEEEPYAGEFFQSPWHGVADAILIRKLDTAQ